MSFFFLISYIVVIENLFSARCVYIVYGIYGTFDALCNYVLEHLSVILKANKCPRGN